MTEDGTDASNDEGKETNTTVAEVTPTNEPSPLEEADRINKEKEKLLDREEKLQDRKEKMLAEEKVGGRARSGTTEPVEQSPEDYVKDIMAGKIDGKE